MLELNMQTALLIYTMCFAIGLIIMSIFYFFIEKRNSTFGYFVLFFLFCVIGSLMIVYRENLGIFVSVIVANSFLYAGNTHLSIGIRHLLGIQLKKTFHFVLGIIFVLLFLLFTYIEFNVIARVVVFNVLIALVLLNAAKTVYTYKREHKDRTITELMSVILLLIVFMMMLRVIFILVFSETSNEFLKFQRDPFMVTLVGLSNLLVITGVLSLVNDLKSKEIVESERSKDSLLGNFPGFAYRCLYDEDWTMVFLSEGFQDLTGYTREMVLNNSNISYNNIIEKKYREDVKITVDRALESHTRCVLEYQIRNRRNELLWVWEQCVGIYDKNNQCIAIEGFITDITSRKNMESNLEYLSYRDHLTGLYNRRFIEEEMKRLDKSRNLPISIIMGDVNGLKFVNDSFGHEQGDLLIQNAAKVLKKSLRGHELIARLSGDEFLIILENTTHIQVEKVVERIQLNSNAKEHPFKGVSIAIGYATKNDRMKTLRTVRKEAEDMMYKQKMYEKPSSKRSTVDAVLGTLFEKDELSEQHSQAVSRLSLKLAKKMKLSDYEIKQTETAGLLHDVGKILIADNILASNTKLSDLEYDEIKKHPEIGYRILSNVPDFEEVANIILCHHERPDGKGYPNGLVDDQIPLISKIISVCDAFDAMTNIRRYRSAKTKEEAIQELLDNAGTQFDPKVVEIFVKIVAKD